VGTRRRDQWGKSLEQLAAFHQDVRGAIAPAVLEPVREHAAWKRLEPLEAERGTQDVAAQTFDALAVPRGHGDIGVQAHAALANAALGKVGLRGSARFLLGFDRYHLVPEPPPRPPGLGSGGDARAHGSSGEHRE
jgi:hypothetical protein